MPLDRLDTIESLEGNAWGPPEYGSHLVTECHRLRKLPLGEFTPENLRIMIGQAFGLQHLLPLALEQLEENPWIAGDYFEGDLLLVVLKVPTDFWEDNPDMLGRLTEIVSILEDQQKMVNDEILPAWRRIFGGQ